MSKAKRITSGTNNTTPDNFSKYEIAEDGRIWSKRFKKWMSPFENVIKHRTCKQHYLRIALYNKNGVRKKVMVHRLVATAFVPNPHNKPFVNHIDGNKHNNDYRNLEWATNKENCHHASKNDLIKKKLTDNQVREIRKDFSNWSHQRIADHFNVSRRLIGLIKQEKRRSLVNE